MTKHSETSRNQRFSYWLLAITMASLVPRLLLGASEAITYDGYWNIFMDTQDRWSMFFSEYQADQHPILFRFLLRAVAHLGHTRLIYRLATVVPGVASVFMIGLAARKLYRSHPLALIAAAAFGFSLTIIDLNIDIRDYSLALFLIITAFYFFIGYLSSDGGTSTDRPLLLSALFSSLAIATEYYSFFFLLACFLVFAVSLYAERSFSDADSILPRGNPYLLSCALWLPILVAIYLYETHLSLHATRQYNVEAYYWKRGSSAAAFLLQNLGRDLNYMSPVELHTAILVPATLLLVAAIYWGLFRNTHLEVIRFTPLLILLALLLQMATLSLFVMYPFGGFPRQQSVIFPFFTLTCFAFLDWLVAAIDLPKRDTTVLITAALLIPIHFMYWWPRWPRNHGNELAVPEYRTLQTLLPTSQAVYVDQFSLIAFYIHTYSANWHFDSQLNLPARVDKYKIAGLADRPLILLRDFFDWKLDLLQPRTYRTIAAALQQSGVSSVAVFRLNQGTPTPSASAINAEEEKMRALARTAGLTATAIDYGDSVVCLRLSTK